MNSTNEENEKTTNENPKINQTKLKTRNNEVLLRGFLFSVTLSSHDIRSRSIYFCLAVFQFLSHLTEFYSSENFDFCSSLFDGTWKIVFDCTSGAYAIYNAHTNNNIVWTMDFYCDFNSLPTSSIQSVWKKKKNYNNITNYRENDWALQFWLNEFYMKKKLREQTWCKKCVTKIAS